MSKDDKIFEAGIHIGKALRHIAEAKMVLHSQPHLLQLVNDLYSEATKLHNTLEKELPMHELYELPTNNTAFTKEETMGPKTQELITLGKKIEAQLATRQLSPQHMEPVAPELSPEKLVFDHLAPAVKNTLRPVMPIVPRGNVLKIFFKPNQASQSALNSITQTVQSLLKQNKLPFPYSVEAVV